MSNPQAKLPDINLPKPNLQELHRVVLSHHWRDASEWGRAVHDLADLSDEEIDRIAMIDEDAFVARAA